MAAEGSERKVFVGGLAPDTTNRSLETHFSQYGEIEDCIVMVDKETSRSRGFGFVTFRESEAVSACLDKPNTVDGKDVQCKKAVRDPPRQLEQDSRGGTYNSVKLFVGGLPATCDYDKLTEYFGRFGKIEDAVVMMDAQTQRHRGFGYVTFSDPSAIEAALDLYKENRIDGKWIEVKRCVPQDKMRSAPQGKGKGRGRDDDRLVPCSSGAGGSGPGYGQYPPPPPGYGQYPPGYGQYPPGYDPYAAYGYPPMPYGYPPPPAYMGYPPDPYGYARYAGYPPTSPPAAAPARTSPY
jgi:RNA-binding protein Musashi